MNNETMLLLDGAMGTQLQAGLLRPGERPEGLCLSAPEEIAAIHQAYFDAGARVLYTNTFGANRCKLAGTALTTEAVVSAAVRIAKSVAGQTARVALDVGPLGALLAPSGTLTAEEAYEAFAEVLRAGEAAGADLIVIETMTDLAEVKCAVLAAKEQTRLPVWVSMSFEETGRTFTGCSVEAMAELLTGLSVDAIGINCSLGPIELLPLAARLCAATPLPVFLKPNAGLPDPATGSYTMTAAAFAAALEKLLPLGIFAVGGCCGSAPEFIRALAPLAAQPVAARRFERKSRISSASRVVTVEGVTVIGERINPTGKKRFKQALLEGDMDYILAQAIAQAEAGAAVLDINVGLPGVDEPEMMERVVRAVQSVCDLPLQLDSSNPEALHRGLRAVVGKPIVNSVNGEAAVLEKILPLCRRYGAAVVGLTLDETGIPMKAEERFAVAERMVDAALRHGIPREDIYIDCLTLTASAQQAEVMETLRAMQLVKSQLGVRTVLGVSNISFGLPNRELVNHSFFLLAMAAGLDLAIINPNTGSMMDAVRAYRLLANQDAKAAEFIAAYGGTAAAPTLVTETMPVEHAIEKGLKKQAVEATRALLVTEQPLDVIRLHLIPALDAVGAAFEQGTLFLPQLLSAATAAQGAFDLLKSVMAETDAPQQSSGSIVLATVKGDIHDIGKNIVKVLLQNYGYAVTDLGRDVAPERVVAAAEETGAPLVGLSALMTTTLPAMRETIALLKARLPDCRVVVGGAVLTASYAAELGADFYAKDAKQTVDIAKSIFEAK